MTDRIAGQPAQQTSDAVARGRQLLQAGRLREALSLAQEELREQPDETELRYIEAVALRYLRQPQQALDSLRRLKAQKPAYARAFQEEGHNLKQLGELEGAAHAYQRAVDLNPALMASWRELAALYKADNNERDFAIAQAEHTRLSQLPRELVSITSLIHEGQLYRAEKLCRAFLQKHPHHIEAMRLLAMLGVKLFVYDDAEFLLESCVELAPDDWLARYDYVNVLHKRQKFEKALEQARILLDAYPDNHAFQLACANENVALGHFDTALQLYDQVIEKQPRFAQPYLSRGHALKTIGRLDEAIGSYRSAYAVKPDFGDAFWSLANLKTYRFTDDEVERMLARVEDAGISNVDRYHLCFALGSAFESRRDYDRSFAFYERGNRLKEAETRYDADAYDAAVQRQIDCCNDELFARKSGMGAAHEDPIFIVGLPRAGSTLLEQVLSSHSMIDGTMELPNIIALAHRLNGRRFVSQDARYPGILAELTAEQLQKLGDRFIEETRVHRLDAPRFIDKMPNNFMHIGLIQLILPNARIIDARRHPLACCFSGFKQLFADGQEFTYGLEAIARYYKGYVRLMAHWDRVLPGKVLRVHYEHVVADLEGQVRRMLEYLGLPFEQRCLTYYETDRSIRTPSSEQVRQPIYRSGLEQWRSYESHLDVLKRELADEISDYPQPPEGEPPDNSPAR